MTSFKAKVIKKDIEYNITLVIFKLKNVKTFFWTFYHLCFIQEFRERLIVYPWSYSCWKKWVLFLLYSLTTTENPTPTLHPLFLKKKNKCWFFFLSLTSAEGSNPNITPIQTLRSISNLYLTMFNLRQHQIQHKIFIKNSCRGVGYKWSPSKVRETAKKNLVISLLTKQRNN